MEIGVRMALGAQRREVLRMVRRESGALALLGVDVGVPIAFGVARALRSMLFGLNPGNPAALFLALTAIAIVLVDRYHPPGAAGCVKRSDTCAPDGVIAPASFSSFARETF